MNKNVLAWVIAVAGIGMEIAIATIREWWPE
jgi:hypothetical protein